jgi:hypothetical protein
MNTTAWFYVITALIFFLVFFYGLYNMCKDEVADNKKKLLELSNKLIENDKKLLKLQIKKLKHQERVNNGKKD